MRTAKAFWEKTAVWLERNRKMVLLALLVLHGAGLAAAFWGFGVLLYPDSPSYIEPAQSFLSYGVMADGDGLPTLFRTPGYILFLAAVYGAGGSDTVVVLLQMAMCLGIGCMIYSIVESISGRAALGLLGLLLWVLHLENYDYTLSILTELPFAFSCVLSLFFFSRYWRRKRYRDIMACFLALNYALLIRPQLMYYSIIVAIGLLGAWLAKKISWRVTVLYVCLFLVCFGGWCMRNYHHFGDPQYTFIRHKDYLEYYAPYVHGVVEKVPLEESKEYFHNQVRGEVPDYDQMPVVEKLYVGADVGKAYVKEHIGAFIVVNLKGLVMEMFAPGAGFIDSFGLPKWLTLCCYGFSALLLAVVYGVYAVGFLKNLPALSGLDWLIFLSNVYLMASTAVVGYSRFRMAFYAPCLIGAFLCWRKFEKKAVWKGRKKGLGEKVSP